MKTFSRTVLPRIVGLLFAAQAVVAYCYTFSIYTFMFRGPVCILMAVLLLLRKRGVPLAIGTVLLALMREFFVRLVFGMDTNIWWWQILGPALAEDVLLLAFVLVNTVPVLKKFRVWVNKLWLLPGAAGILTIFVCSANVISVGGLVLLQRLHLMEALGLGFLEALCAILLPLWLARTAQDDLLPYQEMLGSVITPEQLEEKRRELGLAGRKAK